MAKKISGWKTKGMNRDLSVSAFDAEFAFENRNLRLATNENNTLMSWVNEKGPASISISIPGDKDNQSRIIGRLLGTAVINHQLVLFTHYESDEKKPDNIYVLWYSDEQKTQMDGKRLFNGYLGFDMEHPIETLVSYEAENIQKVYWVDGKNQARLINIKAPDETVEKWNNTDSNRSKPFTLFDFVNELRLQETVTVQKLLGASGIFAPGVIQYAFTYYHKYGQESNIFYTTPLYYISHKDRGASPEDKVDNAFRISVVDVDTNFDYLRIYSIHRTSINSTPFVKRVQDIDIRKLKPVSNKGIIIANYTDTGVSGDAVDPMELLYKGGRTIMPYTLEQKDSTLFFGNFFLERVPFDIIKQIKGSNSTEISLENSTRRFKPVEVSSGSYVYESQLTSTYWNPETKSVDSTRTVPCGGFKHGDYYRLGVQFQYKTGEWSAPVPCMTKNETSKEDEVLNFQIASYPSYEDGFVSVPTVAARLSNNMANQMLSAGYRKVRPVVVFPDIQDRVTVCQGVACPTLYTDKKRDDGGISAQSSWFFRTNMISSYPPVSITTPLPPGSVAPYIGDENGYLEYTNREIGTVGVTEPAAYNPANIRRVEVQGDYEKENKFRVDKRIVTFHSPDVEFDTKLSVLDYSGFVVAQSGSATIKKTVSDIDLQTETPTISNKGSGFVHKSFKEDGPYGIVSGLFYDDTLVDDNGDGLMYYDRQMKTSKWMVYLWNKNGSLNNDFERPADKGVRSAVLKKKVISNLRYAVTTLGDGGKIDVIDGSLQLFSSEHVSLLKWKGKDWDATKNDYVDKDRLYQGNVDTMITPDHFEGMYFCLKKTFDFETWWSSLSQGERLANQEYVGMDAYMDLIDKVNVSTPFNSTDWWKTFNRSETEQDEFGVRRWDGNANLWVYTNNHIGNDYAIALNTNKESVRIKYKSTPHLVFESKNVTNLWDSIGALPILEIKKDESSINFNTLFGGKSNDALMENTWVPCGEPVFLGDRNADGQVEFEYSYGDTYYQRWDCLKTYAFTPEDINQVVEIGSFMLETRVNIDGRYDRNRGQISNINMSPINFNLLNPVYSQIDNFFSYKIMDDREYENVEYPNQVTWSKTKTSGADVDMYTNVTLASVLEMDGDKGEVRKLIRFNDQLISFQDRGIAQVLYNENMQMSTTEGVPIEIANSGKVNGKRYISDSIGCSNKWSIAQTPAGIYFMDSLNKAIFMFNGQMNNLSGSYGFNTWAKQTIPPGTLNWTPDFPMDNGNTVFRTFYDKMNQDVLFVNQSKALAFSERLGTFTSFYDYGNIPFFESLDDTGVWMESNMELLSGATILTLEELDPDYVFKKGDALDVEGTVYECTADSTTKPPFDIVFDETTNKPVYHWIDGKSAYMLDSDTLNPGWAVAGHSNNTHLWKHQAGDYCKFFGINKPFSMTLVGNPEPQTDKIFTNLEFRATVDTDGTEEGLTFTPLLPFDSLEVWDEYQHGIASLENMRGHSAMMHHTSDNSSSLKRKFRIWRCDIPRDNYTAPENNTELNVYRMRRHPNDRMRNPWLYLKLMKNAAKGGALKRTEVHDILMTYFN